MTGTFSDMEPSAAIAVIENDLRHLLDAVLSQKYGQNWMEKAFRPEEIQVLEQRKAEESKRRSPAKVPSSLLSYTHFYQLRTIIEKNWQDFSIPLQEKKQFTVLADKVEDFRNAPAHSRELLPHERALLEGIAGTIRTSVTAFLSTRSPDAKHYPVIEWIRDSFGNEPVLKSNERPTFATGIRLKIGDFVTFDARGWDPQGRDLSWRVSTYSGVLKEDLVAVGTDVTFSIVIDESNVGERFYISIAMSSNGNYHRHTYYDQEVTFGYAVDPPIA